MEEIEREGRSEISSVRLTVCEQQNTCRKDETDIDKKLDISSDQFDPLLALYSSEVSLPYPNVKCFNNLAEYESFMKGGRGRAKPDNMEKKIRKTRRGVMDPERIERLKKLMVKNPCEEGEESGEKRPAAAVKHKVPKNVLTRMPLHEGSPLGELNRCVQYRLRVKVHIRSFKGLRGVCTGFVVAFDKFWNLAMVDVDETYRELLLGDAFNHEKALTVTRLFRKLQVQPASEKAAVVEMSKADESSAKPHPATTSSIWRVQAAESLMQSVKDLAVSSTDVSHISDTGSEQRPKVSKPRVQHGRVRTRHVNQLFIRGENVLLVNIQQE
ncbi:U7 snRNA-associated Sm-like protein LSm11 [Neoarius graeffei]|uniref:U7 snRNA-associated Sm-like protein LSm11 n=1 Tax=Neoarius graeffei TaxID=443677 RepID=UPI00298CE0CB|nr:U7 snRNA-associated Sm-like protein LSm11 [Neoarius graeffei]